MAQGKIKEHEEKSTKNTKPKRGKKKKKIDRAWLPIGK